MDGTAARVARSSDQPVTASISIQFAPIIRRIIGSLAGTERIPGEKKEEKEERGKQGWARVEISLDRIDGGCAGEAEYKPR